MMDKEKQHSQTPLVSVITPTYNAEEHIEETIQSVLNQTYDNYEMVIVDDCSKDRTVEIVQSYAQQEPKIKLIQLETNQGAAVARNTAMNYAEGRFIAFLDSDDWWYPEKLEKQVAFMLDTGVAFSFTKYRRMKENGELTQNISKAPSEVVYTDLLKHCVIGCLTVMLDRDQIGHVQMKNIRRRQDYALWLTLTKEGYKAYGLPEVLAKYRLGHNTVSSNKLKASKSQWYVYREIEKLNVIKSLYYFVHYTFYGIKNTLKSKLKNRT
ncbi:teichuronic acid biosynthesis glycosyltransferase TuaG [Piscibacillus halophilus]|uniref:Teichuronic acid biosynthesis glycosyltransferase TuaG n=2 Tax=Piscibacillus halophilus TaxID=571933 RepID=A0A1H9IQT6_9BACI|nr:teichuronic acid biosynthesis glycosyltransferase TuaG [Piscibacillus halophilus]